MTSNGWIQILLYCVVLIAITAPFGGTVTSRSTDIGDLISATSESSPALFTVADTSKMRLYVSIPQGYAASIKPGMTVSLTVLEHPGKTYRQP